MCRKTGSHVSVLPWADVVACAACITRLQCVSSGGINSRIGFAGPRGPTLMPCRSTSWMCWPPDTCAARTKTYASGRLA